MSDFQDKISLSRIWPVLVVVFVIGLIAVQLLRVNQPAAEAEPSRRNVPFKATTGRVIEGVQTVPAGQFLAVRMDFNKRVDLKGRFWVPGLEERINCLVLDAENLEHWKKGLEYKKLAETGYLPRGQMSLVIQPGTYYLIFDNQSSSSDRLVETYFNVD